MFVLFHSCLHFFYFRYAKEILQKEMLRVGELCETKKAYYFGYVLLVKPRGLVAGIFKY
jgi:hypothetical protein